MFKKILSFVLMLMAFGLLSARAQDEAKCLALVVANATYQDPQDRLENPVNDGKAVSKMLEKLGFNVICAYDVNNESFSRAVRMFGSLSKYYDVAVFYYCGHGAQGKFSNGSHGNFMVPVNVSVRGNEDVVNRCVSLRKVVDALNTYPSKCRTKVLFVDACRSIPSFLNVVDRSEDMLLSLAQYDDCWTIFSTMDGEKADDGESRHSPFAEAWLETMTVPDLHLRDFCFRLAERVKQMTNNEQRASLQCGSSSDWVFCSSDRNDSIVLQELKQCVHSCIQVVKEDSVNKADSCYKDALRLFAANRYEEAALAFIQAAEAGNADAQGALGYCYYYGQGVNKDYQKAVYWYTKAASQGIDYAQTGLGLCYLNGRGVQQDYSKCAEWFTMSALNGDDYAQYFLGICYSLGRGVVLDYDRAAYWFQRSALQGNSDAQEALAGCYLYGLGVEKDTELAIDWYIKAARQGNLAAQQRLKDISVSWE